jgi:hypothetical protein
MKKSLADDSKTAKERFRPSRRLEWTTLRPERLFGDPTILDLARRAGVSKATASKAMSMAPDVCPVRKETREHVLQVAEEIGYRPSWHAKALAHGKSHTVGLLYQGPFPWYLTGVYGNMIQSLAVELQSHGFHLLFVPGLEQDEAGALCCTISALMDALSPTMFLKTSKPCWPKRTFPLFC